MCQSLFNLHLEVVYLVSVLQQLVDCRLVPFEVLLYLLLVLVDPTKQRLLSLDLLLQSLLFQKLLVIVLFVAEVS